MILRELVPGKLRIVRRIGVGGMGVVYEAIHLGLDQRVAVKVIHPLSSESAEARARFLREARALALLRSEHIVQVLDVDTLPEGDPYMVMEYLEGRDLKRELIKRGPLPVDEAVGYLIQACTGLTAAHSAGIIHRDIKPANLFVTNLDAARRVKILDFGVAKFSTSSDQTLTGPTNRIGTPLYMSPEQIAGMEADAHCDLWALGVVLFQLLTGHSPFRPKGTEGTVGAILNGSAESLCEIREDVPLALSQVVARCFEKVHSERFRDASELAAALSPFGPREPTVPASWRAPRGSSVFPAADRADQDLVPYAIPSRPAEAVRLRELAAVTRSALAQRATTQPPAGANNPAAGGGAVAVLLRPAPQGADSEATTRFTARTSPIAAASPKALSVSAASKPADFNSARTARWKTLAAPIALALVGLTLAIGRSRLAPLSEAPVVAAQRATAGAVAAHEIRLRAPAVATLPEPAPAAPSRSAPEPTSSAGRPSRPTSTPARTSLLGTTVKTRPMPKPEQPPPASASVAVPLHL